MIGQLDNMLSNWSVDQRMKPSSSSTLGIFPDILQALLDQLFAKCSLAVYDVGQHSVSSGVADHPGPQGIHVMLFTQQEAVELIL